MKYFCRQFSIVIDIKKRFRWRNVCLVLGHQHGPDPLNEEIPTRKGDGPAEVGLLLRPLHGDAALNERDVQVVWSLTLSGLATEIPEKLEKTNEHPSFTRIIFGIVQQKTRRLDFEQRKSEMASFGPR